MPGYGEPPFERKIQLPVSVWLGQLAFEISQTVNELTSHSFNRSINNQSINQLMELIMRYFFN